MLDRRGILKFLLAGAAGTLLTPLPWKLLEDSAVWTQNWPWIPEGASGAVTWARTTSKLCPSAVGLRVQMIGGRPIRTLPDPEHPLSLGGLSSLAASEVQLLYSPARLRTPLLRDKDGILRPVGYATAQAVFDARLREIRDSGQTDRALCLCGDETGCIREILSLLCNTLRSQHCYFMPSALQPAARAVQAAGLDGLPGYQPEKCDFILCVGADYLNAWGVSARNCALFNANNRAGRNPSCRLVYAGPLRNGTALAAAQWLPLQPGRERSLLWALCRLTAENLGLEVPGAPANQVGLAGCGVPAPVMRELAQSLASARRPLVVTGAALGQGGSRDVEALGYALNLLLPGRALSFLPGPEPVLAGAVRPTEMARRDIYAAKPAADLLISYDANPVYAMPVGFREETGLAAIPFKVAFASCLDETALAADLVFPLPFGLERLDDVITPFGCGETVYCLCPQVVAPPDNLKPAAEILLGALRGLGLIPQTADGREVRNLETLLRARARQLGADFRALRRGEPFTAPARCLPRPEAAELLEKIRAAYEPQPAPASLGLAPLVRPFLGTPVSGIPPYAPKLIPDDELQGNELCVLMNSQTARKLNLRPGRRLELSAAIDTGERLVITARLTVSEDIMDEVIGIPLGYGHAAFDVFSRGKGVNGLNLYSVIPDSGRLAARGLRIKEA